MLTNNDNILGNNTSVVSSEPKECSVKKKRNGYICGNKGLPKSTEGKSLLRLGAKKKTCSH